ncbi:MAG: glycosyltransferase involved in cell wall biosynthesis [Candidatus Poriferisodalaceae bacterium]|jgi:glycosyltransferase involved in cell wall biosynthesis
MRRVLFLSPGLIIGGAERVITTVTAGLDQARFDVHIGVINPGGELEADVAPHVTMHEIGADRALTSGPALRSLVKSLDADVVFSHLTHLNMALSMTRRFLPRDVLTLLGQHSVPTKDEVAVLGRRLPTKALKIYRQADGVVSCSTEVTRELVDVVGLRSDKVHTINNPVDEHRFDPGLPNPYVGPGPHLLGLGTLKPDKAFHRLVEAFAQLDPAIGAQLWIVGEGEERGRIEAQIKSDGVAGRVHLVGATADVEPWITHAAVVVSSSRSEAQPVVILEALAARTPVVAFDCPGGMRGLLEGRTGTTLVPDGDTERLSEAISMTLSGFPSPRLPHHHKVDVICAQYEGLFAGSKN